MPKNNNNNNKKNNKNNKNKNKNKNKDKDKNNKDKNEFYLRTRPNLGILAQIKKVQHFSSLDIIKTFTKYKYAEEFVKNNGDKNNVYFINSKNNNPDKWVWSNNNKGWHKTFYRQSEQRDGGEPPKPQSQYFCNCFEY